MNRTSNWSLMRLIKYIVITILLICLVSTGLDMSNIFSQNEKYISLYNGLETYDIRHENSDNWLKSILSLVLGVDIFNPQSILEYQLPGDSAEMSLWAPENSIAFSAKPLPDAIRLELSKITGEWVSPLTPDKPQGTPQLLIYHTHGDEAFEKGATAVYNETSEWHTNDNDYNVVKLGRLLKLYLERDYNILATHDETNHIPPNFNGAYGRSLTTAKKHIQENSNLKMFIDLHRDAYFPTVDPYRVVNINGQDSARIVVVIGTADDPIYAERTNWKENYKLAVALTNALNKIHPDLCKPVIVRVERFNQHISDNAILVEVGHNKNSIEEAMVATKYLAQALAEVYKGNID